MVQSTNTEFLCFYSFTINSQSKPKKITPKFKPFSSLSIVDFEQVNVGS